MSRFLNSIAVATCITAASAALAGDWHYGAHVECSDCHTQHNSANGQPMRTDNVSTPAPILLRRDTPLDLCISCHDGSNPAAPDVINPISYVRESAAGAFPNTGGVATDVAHHLNSPTAEVPPGGTVSMVLTCTTCHDPHGNDNYRNLRPDPTRTNQPPVSVIAYQPVKADGGNPSQVYVTSNIIYKSGVSAWCGTCHGDPSADHPTDKSIWGSTFADYPTWAGITLPRVPVHSPTDNTIPSQDDQVVCISCHKAHGSANPKATIYADDTSIDSTCEECHNQ